MYGFTTRVKGLNMLTAIIMSTSHGGRFTCKTKATVSYQTIIGLCSFSKQMAEFKTCSIYLVYDKNKSKVTIVAT
jgi:hypothetical protein